jgi:formylglycine-generating enzyme required for sulfatase activity/serine/threonine protein kinase
MPTDPPEPQTENDLDYGVTLRGLRSGLKVFGRYELIRKLGQGGMGVVWLARDDKLDLDIALKFLPDNLVGDESALADLRHETRRCMKLHHTNIVHVYDLVDDDATAAIAMEFVDGRPLSALRAEKASRVMDVADVLPLLRQTCEALTYAHETVKIVHHDLKPANLMLTKDGILKVMDFGIASSLSDSMSKHSRVGQQTGSGGGTLPYMSPQQIMGYPPSVVDDVYALGSTLYELLTSKPPFFRGDLTRQIESITPPTISQRREELGIEGAASVPVVWEQVIAACLEKDADKRPQSVREVWEGLSGSTHHPVRIEKAASAANESSQSRSATEQTSAADVDQPVLQILARKKRVRILLAVVIVAVACTVAFESLSRRVTLNAIPVPTPLQQEETSGQPTETSPEEELIAAWNAVHAQNDAVAVSKAKTVFQSATTTSDPVIAYQGEAGLAAVASVEAGGVQEPVLLYPIPSQPMLGGNEVSKNGNGPWGFIDRSGRPAMAPAWEEAGFFDQGLAKVKQNNREGFIDSAGKLVIPTTWGSVHTNEGLILGKAYGEQDQWSFMDRKGDPVLSADWDQLWAFHEGLAAVKKNGLYGFIDRSGSAVIPPKLLLFIRGFHEGLLCVQDGDKWGFRDRSGRLVIPATWEMVEMFKEGLASVQQDGKWGYIDHRGKLVIPTTWENAYPFSEGLASVKIAGLAGAINRTGKLVIPAEWEFVGAFSEGMASVGKAGKCGFIDHDGKLVIPAVWDDVWSFLPGGLAAVFQRLDSETAGSGQSQAVPARMLYIDKTGKVVWSSDGTDVGEIATPLNALELKKRSANEKSDAYAPAMIANDFNNAKIGDTRVVDLGSGVKLTLCYCPPGSFTMGSPASEADRFANEDQVQVRITKGYWLARTECTQAQWRAVMNTEPSSFKGDDLPVEQVSWEDAQEFLAKLNNRKVLPEGWKWSLPSEAQWEYACRAGTTTPYAGELEQMAWYDGNSGSTTHVVGTKAANAWGLQDMHGNVNEWYSDWYAEKLPGGNDPMGASSGSSRVLRGGSWRNNGQYCRSACRDRLVPGLRSNSLGFRAAAVPVGQ